MKNFASAEDREFSGHDYETELGKSLKGYKSYLAGLESKVAPFEYKNH